MRTQIFNALKITALAIALSFGLSYVYAWTAPTVSPTGGNVNTPLNTSAIAQSKAGSLGIGMTTTPPPATKLQVSNGNIQFDIPATSLANALITWPGGSPNFRLTDSLGVEKINVNSQNGSYTYFNAGNVGIGTATPSQALTVAGAIGATGDICTTTTGPSICLSTPSASTPSHGKQRFTTVGAGVCPSATNCFTVPAGVTKVWVSMAGGGGGGGGGTFYSYGGNGGNGGASSFGSLLTVNGGSGGTSRSPSALALGGSGGVGGGGIASGEDGMRQGTGGSSFSAGYGGGNIVSHRAVPVPYGAGPSGNSYGGGGSGGSGALDVDSTGGSGGGGGGGGGVLIVPQELTMTQSSYVVTVGNGGTAGLAGSGARAGGAGAPGFVLVEW